MDDNAARSLQVACLVIFSGLVIPEENPVQLDKIEITASPYKSHGDLEVAQPAQIMTGDQLMIRTQSTLGETVERELGVSASDFNPIGASRPVIRGLGGQRVMILENGASALDVSDISVDHAVTIEPVLARQVEVLRGPSTLMYGSGAVGGVVNVVNDRIPNYLPEEMTGAVEGRFNSASIERTGAFNVTGGAGDFALHADGMYLRTDDYSAAIGSVDNSAVKLGQWSVGGSYNGESGWLGASVSQLYNNYQIPVALGEEEAPSINVQQTRVNLKSQVDNPLPGFSGLNFDFAWGDYHHTEFENPGEAGTEFDNTAFNLGLQLQHNPLNSWDGAFGVQYANRLLSAAGEEAFIPSVEAQSVAGYLVEERNLGSLHVALGARVEYKTYDPDAASAPQRNFVPYTLNAGGKWAFLENYTLGINLARAERAPQVQELYANGRHVATQTFEIGDPDLKVETSNNIDLTLAKSADRWQWTLNGFYNFYENFIFLQEIDTNGDGQADRVDEDGILDQNGSFLFVRDKQQNVHFYGVEAETTVDLMQGSHGDLSGRIWGDWVRGEFTGGGNVPRLPPWRVGGSLTYSISKWTGNVDVWRAGKQDQTTGVETDTPGYTMLNIDLIYKVPTPRVDFSVFLRGTNMLDEDARRSTSFLKNVAPLPGRAVTIGIRGEF